MTGFGSSRPEIDPVTFGRLKATRDVKKMPERVDDFVTNTFLAADEWSRKMLYLR